MSQDKACADLADVTHCATRMVAHCNDLQRMLSCFGGFIKRGKLVGELQVSRWTQLSPVIIERCSFATCGEFH